MKIIRNYSLKAKNTFGIDCNADYYAEVKSIDDIKDLLNSSVFQDNKFFILGGGSNILFNGDYHGLIINVEIIGRNVRETGVHYAILEGGAGENWSKFANVCTCFNFFGLENLYLIPGKVGAAPVQNIGAYGVEQKDFFHSLSGIILVSGELIEMYPEDCHFGYRDSVFKNEFRNKFIITSVRYKLRKEKTINLTYKELADAAKKSGPEPLTPFEIMVLVGNLRRKKLPDPYDIGNAGSFFKNPAVEQKHFEELKTNYPDIPHYPFLTTDNRQPTTKKTKIPAAWLIEKCGWKGKRTGDAGVYDKHALILVNYGHAKGSDILALASQITESVKEKFGIELEREVLVI